MPTYTATTQEAQRNFQQNPGSRWHQKDASPDQPGGTLAFQRLRQPLFTPFLTPELKLNRDDKMFAIGSCFARGVEAALIARKIDVLSAAPEFSSFTPVNKQVTGLGFTNKYNTFLNLQRITLGAWIRRRSFPARASSISRGAVV